MPGNIRPVVKYHMFEEELMDIDSSGFEETGSITLRLTNKYKVRRRSLNGDTIIIVQDRNTTRTSDTISKEIQRLCSEDFTEYWVRRMFHNLEVNPRVIDRVKTVIVSRVVRMAIDKRKRGLKQFGLVADIEVTNIREAVQENEDVQLRRVLQQSMEERILKRKPAASKSSIEKLKRGRFEVQKNCAVCLDDFENGSEVIWMPCSHMFHEGCLLPWLKESKACPLCRLELTD